MHATSVHSAEDSRIFHRQCTWLAQNGYAVTYVVPEEEGKVPNYGMPSDVGIPEEEAGFGRSKSVVKGMVGAESLGEGMARAKSPALKMVVAGVKKPRTRLGRPLVWLRILARAVKQRPDIFHFHDPELLVIAPFVKWCCGSRVKVVYDVHEYLAASMQDKFWIPVRLRKPAAWLVTHLERFFGRWVDGQVFVAAGQIPNYEHWKTDKIVLHNYPDMDHFQVSPGKDRIIEAEDGDPVDKEGIIVSKDRIDAGNASISGGRNKPSGQADRLFTLVHIGSLYERRGIMTMLHALVILKNKGYCPHLILGGVFESKNFQKRVKSFIQAHGLESQVQVLGWIGYADIKGYLAISHAVWLPHYPTAQHAMQSVCTKQVEAMVAGLPAIVSDIPSLARFVNESNGGLAVPALDPAAHANAVKWLMDHPEDAAAMGKRARQTAISGYVWQKEAPHLGALYDRL